MMGKDDATWLNISYLTFALLAVFVVYKISQTLALQFGFLEQYDQDMVAYVNLALAFVIGLGSVFVLLKDANRRAYHLSAISEIRKVSWPTMPATKQMTIVVVIVVAIFSVILSIFDIVWGKILQSILP